jgi:hypothetical protein
MGKHDPRRVLYRVTEPCFGAGVTPKPLIKMAATGLRNEPGAVGEGRAIGRVGCFDRMRQATPE